MKCPKFLEKTPLKKLFKEQKPEWTFNRSDGTKVTLAERMPDDPRVMAVLDELANQVSKNRGMVTELLRSLDTSGDGELDKEELQVGLDAIMRDIGAGELTEEVLDMLMVVFDEDGSGTVDYLELMDLLTKHQLGLTKKYSENRQRSQAKRMSGSANQLSLRDALERAESERANPRIKAFGMLRPQGKPRVFWDVLTLIFLVYLSISMPYRIAFDASAEGGWKVWESIIDYYFMLDVLVNFRTGYMWEEKDGTRHEEMDWKKVGVQYAKRWFMLDVLSSFPFEILFKSDQAGNTRSLKTLKFSKVLKVVRLLKLSKLLKTQSIVDNFEDMFLTARHQLELTKLFVVSFLFAHFISCAWVFIGTFEEDSGWVWENNLSKDPAWIWINSSVADKYFSSVHWSLQTTTTVGYGDANPTTTAERIYTIVAMIVGGLFYSYVISSMTGLVHDFNVNARMFDEKMAQICESIEALKLSHDIAFQVRKQCKYYLQNKTAIDEQDILTSLPPPLQLEVTAFLLHESLENVELFKRLTPAALSRMFNSLKPVAYPKGESAILLMCDNSLLFVLMAGEMVEELKRLKDFGDSETGVQNELPPITELKQKKHGANLGNVSLGKRSARPQRLTRLRAITAWWSRPKMVKQSTAKINFGTPRMPVLRHFKKHDVFGAIGALGLVEYRDLDAPNFTTTVKADTMCDCLVMSKEEIRQAFSDMPEILSSLQKQLLQMEITASIKAQAADSKKYGPDSNQAKKHGGRLEFWEAEMRLLMTGEAEDEKENVRSSVTPATMAHFAAIVRRSQKLALEAYQRRKANGEDATESAETFDDYIMRAANEAANRSQTVNNASQRSTTGHSAITPSQRYSRLLRSQTSEQSEVASETAKPKAAPSFTIESALAKENLRITRLMNGPGLKSLDSSDTSNQIGDVTEFKSGENEARALGNKMDSLLGGIRRVNQSMVGIMQLFDTLEQTIEPP